MTDRNTGRRSSRRPQQKNTNSSNQNKQKNYHVNHPNGNNKNDNNSPKRRRKPRSKSPNPHQHSKLKKNKSTARLNKGKLAEKYIIKEKLGKGNFAVVRRVIRRLDNKEFAAKIISKKHLSDEEKQEIYDEVNLLKSIRHDNIVQIIEVIDTPRHLYLVLECLLGGELFDRIIAQGHFSEQEASRIVGDIGKALYYLHSHYIVHRDLKPENLIFSTNSPSSVLKVSDFGLAKRFGNSNTGKKKTMDTSCGTPGYVAPEILKQLEYDESVDLWSTGVILYIMLCGFPPFSGGDNMKTLYRKIKKGDYSFPSPAWDNISNMAKDCVRSLLTVDPKKRMNAKQLLNHPWIKQTKLQSPKNIMSKSFTKNLKIYTHKKRLRRGVELIITLNRMIRAAGLEQTAIKQRQEFRIRLKNYKNKIKVQQKELKNAIKNNDLNTLKNLKHVELYPYDDTPPIDYNKV